MASLPSSFSFRQRTKTGRRPAGVSGPLLFTSVREATPTDGTLATWPEAREADPEERSHVDVGYFTHLKRKPDYKQRGLHWNWPARWPSGGRTAPSELKPDGSSGESEKPGKWDVSKLVYCFKNKD